jgi:excisionase family DNA binding protein
MEGSSYSPTDAAVVLGVSVPTVRALVARGQLASFRTPGGHIRIPSESVATYRDGRPNRANPANTTSTALQGRRDNLESLRLETEELRIRRDLRKIQEEEQEVENRRKAEAQATALRRKEERERRQAEAMREADARRQKAAEAEAIRRRRQWEIGWTDVALRLLPKDAPQSLELDVQQTVADALARFDPDQSEQIIGRMVRATVDKAQEPWKHRMAIEKIIEEARNQLPLQARSWSSTPSEWEARAMRAAADAIAQFGDDAPLVKIRATAVEASNKVRAEYEVWKAGEDHRQACEQMVRWVCDGDDAREAVRQALKRLSVGTTRAKMESARDAALAPFRAATKAAADADLYLLHVAHYIEKLGNEETGDWELGNWSERHDFAAELRAKLRPVLIQELLEETMDVDEAHEFIEEWVERELESED